MSGRPEPLFPLFAGLETLDGVSANKWRGKTYQHNKCQLREVFRMIETDGGTHSRKSLKESIAHPAVRSSLLHSPGMLCLKTEALALTHAEKETGRGEAAHLTTVFEMVDTNADGKLDHSELKAATLDPYVCGAVLASLQQLCHHDVKKESVSLMDPIPRHSVASTVETKCCVIC